MNKKELMEILSRGSISTDSYYELRENRAAREVIEVFGEVPEFNEPYSQNTEEHFRLVAKWEAALSPVQVIDESGWGRFYYRVYAPENWNL